MLPSPSQYIEQLGGHRILAGLLRRPPTTVQSWFARNSIPVEAWPQLIEVARARRVAGITYETLAKAHAAAKGEAAA